MDDFKKAFLRKLNNRKLSQRDYALEVNDFDWQALRMKLAGKPQEVHHERTVRVRIDS